MSPGLPILITVAVAALVIGWLIARLSAHREIAQLREHNAALGAELGAERRAAAERIAAMENARATLSDTFTALSHQALKSNTEEFLKLANENLKGFHAQAQGELKTREKAIEGFVKPIREALEKTERQINELENSRKEAYGSLTRHMESMAQTQQLLHSETRNLVQALRRPEVRGQWGEMTLRRLVELAGMVEHCDFFEQEHTVSGDGAMRPDMIVRMPDEREIIVDVKTPLDAYLNAVEATDDDARTRFLEKHARNVRERVRELANKAYWDQFARSPDFIVLFIPGDQFLSAALDHDRTLLEDALRQKVILATPTSLVALLRAVAYGWRQQVLADNAEHIRHVGEELYKRLATFSEHLGRLGKTLNSSLDHYNRAVGSFERQVVPGARKFTEMGIHANRPLDPLEPLEKSAREVAQESPDH
ncbi:MAG: hypothetical protein FD165_733 [Gammaproteobacteria bacterium]|nr:MAG: hypothetical protein FD165_733 [Gammaproteobacteria bacterium]TND07060.1 MAG: hypothetical protein FD120_228 [Gammaproteobacteria bacterium]